MPGCYRSVTDAGYVSRGMTTLPIDPVASSGAVAAPAPRPGWRTLRGANVGDRLYRGALTALALVLPLLLLTLLAELVVSAWPAIKQFGLPFVWNSVWDPVAGGVGAAPLIFCTLASSLLALCLPPPLALRAGVYTTPVAPQRERQPLALLLA